MKDSLKAYYDAALNKTEISDPYFQGMWDEAMKAVRALGDEVLLLEEEQEELGAKLAEKALKKESPPCVKCKHYSSFFPISIPECHHPKNRVVDQVSGKTRIKHPVDLFRDSVFHKDVCNGNLFEMKGRA